MFNAYHTRRGIIISIADSYFLIDKKWDDFINNDNVYQDTLSAVEKLKPTSDAKNILQNELLPPVLNQEIWASGVTYFRSREARIEESKDAGGGDFYDRVYMAERPELFFKSPAYRAVGHGHKVRIRRDSTWNVPEPELALVITSNAKIIGYTIGNDMSSRDIEGENPLYLPQAKSYDGSCSLGPGVHICTKALDPETSIEIVIMRNGKAVFEGSTTISQMKRKPQELVEYLFKETTFKYGAVLFTGTGVVPPDSFTLLSGDEVQIKIDPIGQLTNRVE